MVEEPSNFLVLFPRSPSLDASIWQSFQGCFVIVIGVVSFFNSSGFYPCKRSLQMLTTQCVIDGSPGLCHSILRVHTICLLSSTSITHKISCREGSARCQFYLHTSPNETIYSRCGPTYMPSSPFGLLRRGSVRRMSSGTGLRLRRAIRRTSGVGRYKGMCSSGLRRTRRLSRRRVIRAKSRPS